MNEPSFLITVKSKPYHGLFYSAVVRSGGYDNLCSDIGASKASVFKWTALRDYPRSLFGFRKVGGSVWDRDKFDSALLTYVGAGIDGCWPEEVRKWIDNARGLQRIVLEQTVEVPLLRLSSSAANRLLIEDDKDRILNIEECKDEVCKALKHLSSRERDVIRMRFGLGPDGIFYTLDDCASVFKVTRERLRQIEAKAIRKLQQPSIAGKLVGFID